MIVWESFQPVVCISLVRLRIIIIELTPWEPQVFQLSTRVRSKLKQQVQQVQRVEQVP